MNTESAELAIVLQAEEDTIEWRAAGDDERAAELPFVARRFKGVPVMPAAHMLPPQGARGAPEANEAEWRRYDLARSAFINEMTWGAGKVLLADAITEPQRADIERRMREAIDAAKPKGAPTLAAAGEVNGAASSCISSNAGLCTADVLYDAKGLIRPLFASMFRKRADPETGERPIDLAPRDLVVSGDAMIVRLTDKNEKAKAKRPLKRKRELRMHFDCDDPELGKDSELWRYQTSLGDAEFELRNAPVQSILTIFAERGRTGTVTSALPLKETDALRRRATKGKSKAFVTIPREELASLPLLAPIGVERGLFCWSSLEPHGNESNGGRLAIPMSMVPAECCPPETRKRKLEHAMAGACMSHNARESRTTGREKSMSNTDKRPDNYWLLPPAHRVAREKAAPYL